MSIKQRVFSKEFKLHVVKDVSSGKTQAEIARQYQILPKIICRWMREYETYSDEAFAGRGRTHTLEARFALLERENVRLRSENDLLKKALSCLDSEECPNAESGGSE